MTDSPESLNAFAPVTKAEWIAKVEADLKGASFDSLASTTSDGLGVQPLYTREDQRGGDSAGFPGLFPYLRGAAPVAGWQIRQEYSDPRPAKCAEAITRDLERGVEALWVRLGPRTGCRVPTLEDLEVVLGPVDLATTSIYLDPGIDGLPVAAALATLAERRGLGANGLSGCIGMDPIGLLAKEGRVPGGLRARLRELRGLGTWCSGHTPNLSAVCVASDPYHGGGASAVQELAATLATAVEYLRQLTDGGLGIDAAARQLRFAIPISGDFFGQIAKLRAARWLWAKIISAAGGEPGTGAMDIHARTSTFTKTQRDPWVNMLRATAECTAAILGGAQSIATVPFDALIGTPDELARRLARNTQFVLREESHLDAVADPAGGSWFVENLTRELAEAAWEEFRRIERAGGIVGVLGNGSLRDAIAEFSSTTRSRIAKRRMPVVGVSEFPNLAEDPVERSRASEREIKEALQAKIDELDLGVHRAKLIAISRAVEASGPASELMDVCLSGMMGGGDLYSMATVLQHAQPDFYLDPIPQWRQADAWEALRDRSDRHAAKTGSRPTAFFANLGALPDHKARSTWSQNLLAAGGIEAIADNSFQSAEEVAGAYLEATSDLAIVCGSDADYERLLAPTVTALAEAKCPIILVAGRPREQESELLDLGATAFVFVGADVLSVIRRVLDQIGVAR
ncbi:MAG: methylmalonyl-CoA mutase family protein [Myxococcota bacterium]